jgi:hypothetical protein
MMEMPLALTDEQLRHVMLAGQILAVEKRDAFLQRVAAKLAHDCYQPTDQDVARAIAAALRGLVHEPAA